MYLGKVQTVTSNRVNAYLFVGTQVTTVINQIGNWVDSSGLSDNF